MSLYTLTRLLCAALLVAGTIVVATTTGLAKFFAAGAAGLGLAGFLLLLLFDGANTAQDGRKGSVEKWVQDVAGRD